jgi:hypothetical protein
MRTLLADGPIVVRTVDDAASEAFVRDLLRAVDGACGDGDDDGRIDRRHVPLEALAGGAFLPAARALCAALVPRAWRLELRTAFVVRYAPPHGHSAHEDPPYAALTINLALSDDALTR